MANDGSVVIRIDGDASGYKKALQNILPETKAGLADIKAGLDMASAAAQNLWNVTAEGVKYTANIEQLQTSFEVMTGSAEKAAEVVSRLRTMGAETPFELADIAGVTQLLMQYGFTADDALDKMKMLGDISQGNAQALESIAMGYAQMSSAQKVNLQDIKQMINGGFNPLQEISERTGESMASLYERISKGTMTVDEITESMRHATSEGGKFFQSMDKQSQTLNGRLSTLKDNASQLLGSLTEGLSEELRDELLPLADNMVSTLQEAFDERGMEGLLDTATGMLPDLLNMMTGRMEDSIVSLGKFAPKAVQSIMRTIPTAIRSGTAVLPQITTALFDTAALVVEELVVMLPDLVPVVVSGFADMLGSALTGTVELVGGFFNGIERAIHKGQTKVAGMWVDDEKIAKYDFSMEIDVDTSDADSAIETAYSEVRTALNTDLLNDEQKNAILAMIGEDYQEIYDKLISFGLSPEDAGPIATKVTEANATIQSELSKLNVGVDATTLVQWIMQAAGSRLALKNTLKSAGLSETDVQQVLSVYDTMLGKVTDGTPSIVESIYDKLTDGEPDDTQTVETISGQIQTYIDGLLAALETAYQSKLSELDVTAEDYKEKKAALDAWYESTKTSITDMDNGMRTLVSTLAGAPTSVVQKRMTEFIEMEQMLFGLEEEIDRMTVKAAEAAENAFRVVRAGANADEETISMAIKFKATEYDVDVQSAEDQYAAAREELDALFASGDLTKEEYDTRLSDAQTELETAKASAKAAYEQALREIFQGVAESEGISAAVEEAGAKINLAGTLETAIAEMKGQSGWFVDTYGEEYANYLAGILEVDPSKFEGMSIGRVREWLIGETQGLYTEAGLIVRETDSSKLQEAYQAALGENLFEGTSFDTSEQGAQFAAIIGSIATDGATQAAPEAQTAGQTILDSVTTAMSGGKDTASGLGKDYADGYIGAIKAQNSLAYLAGYNLAKSTARGTAAGQKSASPSKVARGLGNDFGDGYGIGVQESMVKAAAIAKRMTGGIATAVDIAQSTRVNIPTLQQEIVMANEQYSPRLYVNGRELGRVMAADTRSAQNNYNRSLALGVGR